MLQFNLVCELIYDISKNEYVNENENLLKKKNEMYLTEFIRTEIPLNEIIKIKIENYFENLKIEHMRK
jgi:hypothetical protein